MNKYHLNIEQLTIEQICSIDYCSIDYCSMDYCAIHAGKPDRRSEDQHPQLALELVSDTWL